MFSSDVCRLCSNVCFGLCLGELLNSDRWKKKNNPENKCWTKFLRRIGLLVELANIYIKVRKRIRGTMKYYFSSDFILGILTLFSGY